MNIPEVSTDEFVVGLDLPTEFVDALSKIYPVRICAFSDPQRIIGRGRAAQWAGWMSDRAQFTAAIAGWTRGRLFRDREIVLECENLWRQR